jgi:hypothetical protein
MAGFASSRDYPEYLLPAATMADDMLDLVAVDAYVGEHVIVETAQLLDGAAAAALLGNAPEDARKPGQGAARLEGSRRRGGVAAFETEKYVYVLRLHDHHPCSWCCWLRPADGLCHAFANAEVPEGKQPAAIAAPMLGRRGVRIRSAWLDDVSPTHCHRRVTRIGRSRGGREGRLLDCAAKDRASAGGQRAAPPS